MQLRNDALRRRQGGLSLLELMLVVGLVAILSAIAVPTYRSYQDRAKVAQAVRDIGDIQQAIERFRTAQMQLPDDFDAVNRGGLRDPWGNAYIYYDYASGVSPDPSRRDRNLKPLNTDYDLYSKGKDGASATQLSRRESEDDVVRGLDGSFIGLGKDF